MKPTEPSGEPRANPALLQSIIARLFTGYLRLCLLSGKFEVSGLAALRAALEDGPVIVVCWHSRLVLAPPGWPKPHLMCTLYDTSPVGQLSGAVQRRWGLRPLAMAANASNLANSRKILQQLRRENTSVGLAADGPSGPAHQLKPAALDWARASGRPIFVYAWAGGRSRRLKSWDAMLMPRLFDQNHAAFAPVDLTLPRRPLPAERAAAEAQLAAALDAICLQVDESAGVRPGP